MRFGLNLRGDLAKLSDGELVERLQSALDHREWLETRAGDAPNRWLYRLGFAFPFGRGLLHARIFYKFIGLYGGGPLNWQSIGDLYVLDCEIKDLQDEMARRLKAKKA